MGLNIKEIQEKNKDDESAYEVISSYIDKSFISNDVINNFKKLETLLNELGLTDNINLIIKLIKENSLFVENLNKILARYYSMIVTGNTEKLFGDGLLCSIIELYCDIKNIEIKDEINIDENEELDNYRLYMSDIDKYPLLTITEEQELCRRIHEGDSEARNIFINSNLRLVVKIAKRYLGRGLEFMDLISEGNVGLIKAVDRYDASQSYKFSTYAVWWIKKTILMGIKNYGRTRRIPTGVLNKYERLVRVENELRNKLGREPKEEELAKELGYSIDKIRELYKIKDDTVSINTYVGDEDTELGELLPSSISIEDEYIKNNITKEILKLFEDVGLSKREIEVIVLRNGFISGRPMTLKAISKRLGITIERTRQIETKAINKIRESKYIDAFAEYTSNPDEALRNIKIFKKEYLLAKSRGDYTYSLQRNGNNRKGVYTKAKERPTRNKTIYQYLDGTIEQANIALGKISSDDRKTIELFFEGKLDKKGIGKFYTIVKKLNKLIANPNYVTRHYSSRNESKVKVKKLKGGI